MYSIIFYSMVRFILFICPMWARELCRISQPRFLPESPECRMRRLNQASFVLLYFALFAFFSGLCLVFVVCYLYFPACTNVSGTA